MKVLDLFSGLNGWSDPWKARGHEVFTIDNDPKFGADLVKDMLKVTTDDLPWQPDVILASPPCTAFTVMRIGTNWTEDHRPKTIAAQDALELVWATVMFIVQVQPAFWVIENPRGKLRKLSPMTRIERKTVTYCQYGDVRMKPTDLWSAVWHRLPSLKLKDICANGMPCHTAAPRGSRTATQGMDSDLAAKIPADLSLAFCLAAEKDL